MKETRKMACACNHTWLSESSAQVTLTCAVQCLEFSLWKPRLSMDQLALGREKCWKSQHKGCWPTHAHSCAIMLLGEKEWLPFPQSIAGPQLHAQPPENCSCNWAPSNLGRTRAISAAASPRCLPQLQLGEVVDGCIPWLGLCPPLVTQLQFRVLLPLSKMVI